MTATASEALCASVNNGTLHRVAKNLPACQSEHAARKLFEEIHIFGPFL